MRKKLISIFVLLAVLVLVGGVLIAQRYQNGVADVGDHTESDEIEDKKVEDNQKISPYDRDIDEANGATQKNEYDAATGAAQKNKADKAARVAQKNDTDAATGAAQKNDTDEVVGTAQKNDTDKAAGIAQKNEADMADAKVNISENDIALMDGAENADDKLGNAGNGEAWENGAEKGNPSENSSPQKNEAEVNNKRETYINHEGKNILERFNPPEGYIRVDTNDFGNFIREYPLLESGAPVYLYDGSLKWNQDAHLAVFAMSLVQGDLQQCADSCIRLYAEYFYKSQQYDKIAFHLVNGFLVDFDTWRNGGRVLVDGNKTEWVMSAEPSDSWETFEKYLRFVFTYASTLSMDAEAYKTDMEQMQIGDFFLKGGSPGHVVMVLDVCENALGEKAFLLGQGYMPAQQFHVLKNPGNEKNPWYYLSDLSFPLVTPEYVFSEGSFKRPIYDE